jgi:hypothetical protein
MAFANKHVSTATIGYNKEELYYLCGMCRGIEGRTSPEKVSHLARVAVAEACGKERKQPPLEAVTRVLVKTQLRTLSCP